MDKATVAIIVSVVSACVAFLSLGWNIYRDVILKPRLKVKFAIRELFRPGVGNPPSDADALSKFISISASNFGARSTAIQKIRIESMKKNKYLLSRCLIFNYLRNLKQVKKLSLRCDIIKAIVNFCWEIAVVLGLKTLSIRFTG